MTLPVLVSASANPHKVAEIASLLEGLVELLPRPDGVPDVVEDAGSLEGNARLKAAAICAATGLAAVSDDTGLFVDALDGEPRAARRVAVLAELAREIVGCRELQIRPRAFAIRGIEAHPARLVARELGLREDRFAPSG